MQNPSEMLTYILQMRKLEIRVVDWSAQGCIYVIE